MYPISQNLRMCRKISTFLISYLTATGNVRRWYSMHRLSNQSNQLHGNRSAHTDNGTRETVVRTNQRHTQRHSIRSNRASVGRAHRLMGDISWIDDEQKSCPRIIRLKRQRHTHTHTHKLR